MRNKLAGLTWAALLVPGLLGAQVTTRKAPGTAAEPPAPTRYLLASSGNEVQYAVREELAGINFPYDAVGKTSVVVGAIMLDENGAIVSAESHITVDVSTLKSDRANRDRYLKTKALETDSYPKVDLAITALRNFPASLPTSGEFTFELIGNLTVRTVTKPVIWQVTATATNGELSGTAKTAFKFGYFGMDVPSAFMVMKLEDNLKLQFDFHFVRDATAKP